jgi:hypothetical protein
MDPFTIAFLAAKAVSTAGSLIAAKGQADSARLNSFNIQTQKELNDAAAMQRANDRYEQFKLAESANRALLAGAMGRDIGGEDRSVAAFLKRNRESAFSDMDRMETQRQMEGLNFELQAQSERRRAKDIMFSGVVNAFSSAASTMMQYDQIRGPTASPLAPTTSPRPTMRPR